MMQLFRRKNKPKVIKTPLLKMCKKDYRVIMYGDGRYAVQYNDALLGWRLCYRYISEKGRVNRDALSSDFLPHMPLPNLQEESQFNTLEEAIIHAVERYKRAIKMELSSTILTVYEGS